jgi:hypothetical protein
MRKNTKNSIKIDKKPDFHRLLNPEKDPLLDPRKDSPPLNHCRCREKGDFSAGKKYESVFLRPNSQEALIDDHVVNQESATTSQAGPSGTSGPINK